MNASTVRGYRTSSVPKRDNSVARSSTNPSARWSSPGLPERLSNGASAIASAAIMSSERQAPHTVRSGLTPIWVRVGGASALQKFYSDSTQDGSLPLQRPRGTHADGLCGALSHSWTDSYG